MGLLSPTAFAQATAPSIVPTGTAPTSGALVPAPVAAPLPSSAKPMIELSFRDVEVSDLLDIISRQFDVQVVISSDVTGIKLASINLTNKTPEAAIQAVVGAAGLKYRKQADGTFLIGKNLADEPAASINPVGGNSGFGSGFGNGLPTGVGGMGTGFNDGALPQLGGDGSFNGLSNNDFNVQELVGNSDRSSARKRQQLVRVRNVSPRVMAYWLDPANNELPAEFRMSRRNGDRYNDHSFTTDGGINNSSNSLQNNSSFVTPFNGNGNFNPNVSTNPYINRGNAEFRSNAQFGGGNNNNNNNNGGNRGNNNGGRNGGNGRGGAGGGVFQLPEGVDRIVAIDPQNALLVFGTDEGVRELTETIAFLDKPLRQVEIEAQFVTVSTSDSRAFGIDFSTSQGNFNANGNGFAPSAPSNNGSFQLGFVRGNFQATLSALLAQSRAKVITAPRVTAINNLTASLQSSTVTTVVLTSVSQNINGNLATQQTPVFISTNIGLTVTPTINNDDTITVLMQPELSTQTPTSGLFPDINQQTLETIANVRDGDTIALGGLKAKTVTRSGDKVPVLSDIPILGSLFKSRRAIDQESDLIIFLTARIIRRAGDEDAVPGT